jgi:hypothetical protein
MLSPMYVAAAESLRRLRASDEQNARDIEYLVTSFIEMAKLGQVDEEIFRRITGQRS